MFRWDKDVNRNGWLWLAPEYFNQWRVFPRAFIIFYFWLCFETAVWFMTLVDPSAAQAGFAGAIVSVGAAWFGLYVNSGNSRPLGVVQPGVPYQLPPVAVPESNPARRPEDEYDQPSHNEHDPRPRG